MALGAMMVFGWALFWDRSRGRRRCPGCWRPVDDEAVAERVCTECGSDLTSERRLSRTRRRWGWASAACVLMLGAIALGTTPAISRHGWRHVVPSGVLLRMWPAAVDEWIAARIDNNGSEDAGVREIDHRLANLGADAREAALWRERVETRLREMGRMDDASEAATLKKLEERRVTISLVAERMEDVLAELETSLGVRVEPDWRNVKGEQLTRDMRVSLTATGATGVDALDQLMRSNMLGRLGHVTWRIEGDKVVVGAWAPERSKLPVRVHELKGTMRGEIEAYVRRHVAEEEAGLATVTVVGDAMFVRATPRMHAEVEGIVSGYVRASERAGASASAFEQDWAETLMAYKALRASSVDLDENIPNLEQLAQVLQALSDRPIDVDWPSLARIHVRPDLPLAAPSGRADGVRLLDEVTDLLAPEDVKGAGWTITHGVVRISESDFINGLRIVRFYNVADLLSEGVDAKAVDEKYLAEAARDLEGSIADAVDPDNWIMNGGDSGDMKRLGTVLAIRTTSRNHLAINEWLDERRGATQTP